LKQVINKAIRMRFPRACKYPQRCVALPEPFLPSSSFLVIAAPKLYRIYALSIIHIATSRSAFD
jgi:hypothetical protein